jgi:nucleotide-binding universal stress UspA family protein
MDDFYIPASVVVGIDGSWAALRAALWAVDEAVSRDIPLRLIYAIGHPHISVVDADEEARRLATAEIAIRYALMAVEATDKPVKIEVEIDQGHPLSTLVRASRSAAMVCVGAAGLNHDEHQHVGSIAANLATSAHGPIAIIREHGSVMSPAGGRIVVEAIDSADNDVVLAHAMEEAQLRNAGLHAVTRCRCGSNDIREHPVPAGVDRRLTRWAQRYPDVDVHSVAVHRSIGDYLADLPGSVQLVVVGSGSPHGEEGLGEHVGHAALQHAKCSVLVV